MFDPVMPYIPPVSAFRNTGSPEAVKQEFAVIFYKEMLKQAFSSFSDEKDNLMSATNREVLLQKFAEELARKNINLIQGVK